MTTINQGQTVGTINQTEGSRRSSSNFRKLATAGICVGSLFTGAGIIGSVSAFSSQEATDTAPLVGYLSPKGVDTQCAVQGVLDFKGSVQKARESGDITDEQIAAMAAVLASAGVQNPKTEKAYTTEGLDDVFTSDLSGLPGGICNSEEGASAYRFGKKILRSIGLLAGGGAAMIGGFRLRRKGKL